MPASVRMLAMMALVVVLPWVPATDTPWRPSMSAARAALRCQIRRPSRRASTSSGLSS